MTFSKFNLILLIAVTMSALYVTDLRMGIKRQTHLYGKGQEEEIRLNQERAELLYEQTKYSDKKQVMEAATRMKMHEPKPEETVALRF
ncbi:cell division protein FtsL [Kingella negevensis]|uniref:Cell division protein FtsL n=1 Tax=Kingella negevensis TaxID=1522312 RepID=A0A238T9G1_9NEIS|nr:cell division protein FtsL [Kingella negevensis]MDK4680864.1 cell division protein FtsL [Kingella negevensis]MDK4681413.1 cell division protein FtsL [Kingella negevensis]MDK4684901.1 cell division protein FtsL [Kingella negevensis]MDK4687927.1 cell division protein FtsL [Kingella negevensis]MDK4691799.1 cell division protein FtsL [Kingella negevensis]